MTRPLPPLRLCSHGDDANACQLRHAPDRELCKHGYSTYTDDAGRVHIATGGRCSDVPIPADPERDARVAARRAADARKAGRALDDLLADNRGRWREVLPEVYDAGWRDGYAASEEQHNRHYVPYRATTGHTHDGPSCSLCEPAAGYGAPGCDCPYPEKVSETCPLHGTQHNAHYGHADDCLCPGETPHPERGMQPGAAAHHHARGVDGTSALTSDSETYNRPACTMPASMHTIVGAVRTHLDSGAPCADQRSIWGPPGECVCLDPTLLCRKHDSA